MSLTRRSIKHVYEDPLTLIWIDCAEKLGFRIVRTSEVYASYDGAGTLLIGEANILDEDDHLGQMVFHELCHALVQGASGESQADWGLSNQARVADPWREHAALRVQAWLSDRVGLRRFFAPTTDYRESFWNGLGNNPLGAVNNLSERLDLSRSAAILALHRANLPRWRQPLDHALISTQRLAQALLKVRKGDEGHQSFSPRLPSLWDLVDEPPSPHFSGQSWVVDWFSGKTCGNCAWGFSVGKDYACRRNPSQTFSSTSACCAHFEPVEEVSCESCGACCREAFDTVELRRGEMTVLRHPHWVLRQGDRLKLARSGGSCIALRSDGAPEPLYRCSIYDERPETCRGFTLRSEACLEARQRVGISS